MRTNLAHAAQRLLTAEQTHDNIQSYWDNLPADQDYDLGVRVDWSWGGSTTGYEEVQRAVRKDIRDNLRQFIASALADAKAELRAAQQALKEMSARL